ncbi:MAG TPA: hypothetical protein ENJ42_09870 [Hellea balneolensis]|uniref:chorismate mutase n=1 Tax=Hellea balneolensis TaxID=287478 RepID=A0A7C5LYA1_9PROT|nr:hypothetical protein [Hellea balneolensis]
MSKDTDKLPKDMRALRDDINRVDGQLLDLIARRMKLAQAVRNAKGGVDVWRPSREESHVRNLIGKAGDIPPKLVSRVWAELTSASLSLQGPIQLHIALVGDALSKWTLVRDRFGAAIPAHVYPTASAALAAAQSEAEGVAVLPAPGEMNNWWTALGPHGAASNMHILAALPRIGNDEWPTAVAVSKAQILPSGFDQTLLMIDTKDMAALVTPERVFLDLGYEAVLRARVENFSVYSVQGFVDIDGPVYQKMKTQFSMLKIIGVLPLPIPTTF